MRAATGIDALAKHLNLPRGNGAGNHPRGQAATSDWPGILRIPVKEGFEAFVRETYSRAAR